MTKWEMLASAMLVTVIVLLIIRLGLRAYFQEKEAFVDRLVKKVKGVGDNGKVS